jgi:folate-dependent phosphoribosylglycinamide formyltransferase PurN
MKLVYVTSDVTYVKDNYLNLLEKVTSTENLPSGCEVASVVLLKIPLKLLLKNIIGLTMIGAPGVGLTLMRNLTSAKVNDPRVKLLEKRGIPYFRCKSVNQKHALDYLSGLNPDLIVNMRTRNIYKKPVLDLPNIGCINIHHGLLPDNRGTMCDLWAWVEKRPVGFSVHWMNEKIDDGKIITTQEVDIKGCKSYIEIPYRSSLLESGCLIDSLKRIQKDGQNVGYANITNQKHFTRNPDIATISSIRHQGFRL